MYLSLEWSESIYLKNLIKKIYFIIDYLEEYAIWHLDINWILRLGHIKLLEGNNFLGEASF